MRSIRRRQLKLTHLLPVGRRRISSPNPPDEQLAGWGYWVYHRLRICPQCMIVCYYDWNVNDADVYDADVCNVDVYEQKSIYLPRIQPIRTIEKVLFRSTRTPIQVLPGRTWYVQGVHKVPERTYVTFHADSRNVHGLLCSPQMYSIKIQWDNQRVHART